MFGVLVVKDPAGTVGFLAAFSGNLAGSNSHEYFVPPIYDMLRPGDFFRTEEASISDLNRQIETLETAGRYRELLRTIEETETEVAREIAAAKARMRIAKTAREARRREHPDENTQTALVRESQYEKAELHRLKQSWKNRLASLHAQRTSIAERIESLRCERKARSAALQAKLFRKFRLLNALGEIRDLAEIFAPTPQGTPPAGAGECAAPKLLQQAYLHGWKPIAMAEFWWGDSPKTEIRHHGHYYPACKGKCEPILHHMLQGLRVDENPLLADSHRETKLDILYEDDYLLVINKPEGMLSVPGKGDVDSVYQRLSILYPEATGPIIVHRLDMATSGLLLAAKTKEAHQNLQAQFKNRTIQKRYIALLEGEVPQDEGEIRLPLCPDPLDRPRQIVSEEFGKPAFTRYRVLERTSGKTLIAFYPQTGRTHQLRVHAAHPLGLHCPILGDELYGRKAERLYLHAEYLAFTHPITSERIEIQKSPAFPRCSMP